MTFALIKYREVIDKQILGDIKQEQYFDWNLNIILTMSMGTSQFSIQYISNEKYTVKPSISIYILWI